MINKKYPWFKRTLALLLSASLISAGVLSADAEDFGAESVFSDSTADSENAEASAENTEQNNGSASRDDAADAADVTVSDDADTGNSSAASGSSDSGNNTSADNSGTSTGGSGTAADASADASADSFISSDEETFSSGEADTDSGKDLDYVLGRPMTEEEIAEQLAMMQNTAPIEAAPDVESELGISSYALYPETYNTRDLGFVTPVKNQQSYNICWAFSLASNFETALLNQGLDIWDLSEEHLCYFWANRVNDPLGNTPNDKMIRTTGNYHSAGNGQVASFFLSTWSGMVTEDKVPLNAGASGLDESLAYDTDVYMVDAVFSNYWGTDDSGNKFADTDRMKALVTEYHSVSIMFYQNSAYYNAETASYCCPSNTSTVNHAVTVVGWDDNYSKDNFKEASGVQNDGAWIIKNSYGTTYGKEGYIYLSYEDASIKNLVCNTVTDSPAYPNNYFYDGASTGTSHVTLQSGYSVASIFTATAGNGNAEELGEVVLASRTDYADFKIQIYTDLTDPSDPTSGTLASEMEYTQPLAGIDTVELENPVKIRQGSQYSVVVTLLDGTITYYVEKSTTQSWFSAEAGLDPNQTFLNLNTGTWIDTGIPHLNKNTNTYNEPYCISLKAHTRTLDAPMPTPTPVPTATPTPAPKTYTVTYKSNTKETVSSLPSDKTKYTSGKTVTVKSGPYRSSLYFTGWNTRADGKGTSYTPGKTFKITKNITLYAQWKKSTFTVSSLKYQVTSKTRVTCCGTTNKKLKTLKIPDTVKYAGVTYKVTTVWHNAFKGMTLLNSATIGNNVTCIGKYAFYGCSNLKKVTIGTGLTWIRVQAFRGVKKGCTITIKSTGLTKVDSRIDQSTSKMVVKVPKKKLSAYKKLLRKKSATVTVKAY